MSLARDLVELSTVIGNRAGVDPFAPIDSGGLLETPECASMPTRLRSGDATRMMRLCLQVLQIQREELSPHLLEAELVATLPPETPGIARPTEQVIRGMIEHAAAEIVLLGYEITDQGFVDMLADAAERNVDIIMICDRARGAAARVLESWPAGTRSPRIFCDRERSDGAPHASMHAKCLLIDGKDLLVTSANFTFHGLHGNIEIGIRLCGSPAAEARKIFSHLVQCQVLEDVSC